MHLVGMGSAYEALVKGCSVFSLGFPVGVVVVCVDVLSALAAAPRGRGWAEMGLCGDLVCRVSLVAPHRLL